MKLSFTDRHLELENIITEDELSKVKRELIDSVGYKKARKLMKRTISKVNQKFEEVVHVGEYTFLMLHHSPKIGVNYRVIKIPKL